MVGDGMYGVGIPHADDISDCEFAHEETIHPAETELDEFYSFFVEMFC
jgi:hypothetical protein